MMSNLNLNRSPSHDDPAPAFQTEGDTPDSQIWKADELAILRSHIVGYRGARRKKKAAYVVSDVIPQIKATWKGRYDRKSLKKDGAIQKEWSKKKEQIFTWFGNHASSGRGLKIPGFNKKITFNTVLNSRKKQEIQEEVKKLAGGAENSKKWLPHYQNAKKAVKEWLTEDEKESIQDEVEEWNTKGVPSAVQAESASKHGRKILQRMDELRWNTMGMRGLFLENHYNADGKMCYSIHDTQTAVSAGTFRKSSTTADGAGSQVPTFAQYAPEAMKALKKEYIGYISTISSIEKGTDKRNPITKFSDSDLTYTTSGFPQVPPPIRNVNGTETSLTQQHIIRSYFTAHYTLTCGKKKPVPYSTIVPQWRDYVDEIYLPTGVEFKEPSRYNGSEAHRILKLWRTRQENGEVVFKFEQYVGPNKEQEEAVYEAEIFEGLTPAGNVAPQVSQERVGGNIEDEEEDEQEKDDDNDARRRRHRAAADSDEEEDEDQNEEMDPITNKEGEEDGINTYGGVGQRTEHRAGKRPGPQRRVISPIEDEAPSQEIEERMIGSRKRLTRRRVMSSEEDNDGPRADPAKELQTLQTLVGSSDQPEEPPRGQRWGRMHLAQQQGLQTPEPSQTSTPAAADQTRGLRPKTIAAAKESMIMAAAKKSKSTAAAKELKAAGIKTRSKGSKKRG